MDENIRRFNAEVPQIWQWDDHEVVNNWSPGKQLDERYKKDIQTLVGRARQAWLEYSPMRLQAADNGGRIYRKLSYGPMLDVFVLDMRSYRGANDDNLGAAKPFLGREQLDWLKHGELKTSRAQWKVIAADMPIGLGVPDGEVSPGVARWEAVANGDPGPAQGRELEVAELLGFPASATGAQFRVPDGRRALLRCASLSPGSGRVSGFRAVLGVRRRAIECRELRA
jgi:alkaline phosphatase D